MTRTILPHRFRPLFLGLLALCLAPAATDPEGIDHRGRFGGAPKAVLLDTLTVSAVGDLKNDEKRSRTSRIVHPGFALPPYGDLLPPRGSSLLPAHGSSRIFSCIARAGITIRAPPLRRA